MMSWYNMVAARRSKSLMTGNVRCGVAAVHEVLGSLALEIPVNCHFELMEGTGGHFMARGWKGERRDGNKGRGGRGRGCFAAREWKGEGRKEREEWGTNHYS